MPKKKRKSVKVCPVCHSPRIKLSSQFDGWLTPEVYICMDCGYRGPIVLEVDIDGDNNEGNS